MSLIEMMIVMAVISIVALGVAQLMQNQQKNWVRAQLIQSAESIRSNVREWVRNDRAWSQTVLEEKNEPFKCLRTATSCKALEGPSFHPAPVQIKTSNGATYFDGSNPRAGFTFSGQTCFEFPSSTCSLRLDLEVAASCDPGTDCTFPMLQVAGKVRHQSAPQSPSAMINPENYRFEVVRSSLGSFAALINPSPSPTLLPTTLPTPQPTLQAHATPPTTEPSPLPTETPDTNAPFDVQKVCQLLGQTVHDPKYQAEVRGQLILQGMNEHTARTWVERLSATCNQH